TSSKMVRQALSTRRTKVSQRVQRALRPVDSGPLFRFRSSRATTPSWLTRPWTCSPVSTRSSLTPTSPRTVRRASSALAQECSCCRNVLWVLRDQLVLDLAASAAVLGGARAFVPARERTVIDARPDREVH